MSWHKAIEGIFEAISLVLAKKANRGKISHDNRKEEKSSSVHSGGKIFTPLRRVTSEEE